MEIVATPRGFKKHRLCLHRGASEVGRNDVAAIPTPPATSSWTPIAHLSVIEAVESALTAAGLKLGTETHSLSHDGARYFGLIEVQGKAETSDYGWVLGMRNSHDQRFSAGIVAGAKVFVCDNLSFSGEVRLARKHTRFIQRDLPALTGRAVGKLLQHWNDQDQRIAAYKNSVMPHATAHDLLIRAVDLGACPNRLIPQVVKEWRQPRHPEFQEPTAWSLFNAFTEILKGNLLELPRRSQSLHALFDTHVGLALRS